MNAPHAWAKPLVWSRNEIRRRVARPGSVLSNLRETRAADRGPLIQRSLEDVYTPTEHSLDILQKLLAIGINHANARYSTAREFSAQVHSLDVAVIQSGSTCLTGLAGVGKTSLIRALGRVVPTGVRVEVDVERGAQLAHPDTGAGTPSPQPAGPSNGLSSFPVVGAIHLPIKNALTSKDVLCKLLADMGNPSPAGSLVTLETEARRKLYAQGVSLLLADEMQKLTGSLNANTKVTQLIYMLADLGLPLVYIANFSLCHKLQRRPQEDRRRLFSDVIVMRPEAAGSKDWEATVLGHLTVLEEAIDLDARRDAELLHDLTQGINYIAIKLLRLACERALEAGRAATAGDLEWVAHHSERFHSERVDLQRLRRQALTGQQLSEDLWCPFDQGVVPGVAQREKQRFQAEVVRSMVMPSGTSAVAGGSVKKVTPRAASSKVRSLESERQSRIEEGLRRLAGMQGTAKPLKTRPDSDPTAEVD